MGLSIPSLDTLKWCETLATAWLTIAISKKERTQGEMEDTHTREREVEREGGKEGRERLLLVLSLACFYLPDSTSCDLINDTIKMIDHNHIKRTPLTLGQLTALLWLEAYFCSLHVY